MKDKNRLASIIKSLQQIEEELSNLLSNINRDEDKQNEIIAGGITTASRMLKCTEETALRHEITGYKDKAQKRRQEQKEK